MSIQPERLIRVSGGMGAPVPATETRGELTVRAIVVQQGTTRVAIVSLDSLGFPGVLCDRVRARVPGILGENIVIGSTHRHSAPDCYAFPDGKGGHTSDLAYIDFVVEQTAAAINAAVESLQPAKLRSASGMAEGKIAYIITRTVRFPVDSDAMWMVITLSPLNYPHQKGDRSVMVPIDLINLGDSQFLTIPGEALPNIGFYLKRKMKGDHQFLLGLTNEAFGYILTKVDFASFPSYDYVSGVSLGEMTGEILIENALEMIEQSPLPDKL